MVKDSIYVSTSSGGLMKLIRSFVMVRIGGFFGMHATEVFVSGFMTN